MNHSKKNVEGDVLDYIFKDRNKLYGAYELRRNYSSRLYKAICISFGVVALLLALILYRSNIRKPQKFVEARVYVLEPVHLKPQEEKKQAQSAPKKAEMKKPEIKKTSGKQGKIVMTNEKNLPKMDRIIPTEFHSEIRTGITGLSPSSLQEIGIGGVQPGSSNVGISHPQIAPDSTRWVAEVMPEYPGGKKALLKFLQKNLQSPAPLQEGEMVKVRIQFVVGYDGKLKGFTVLEDGGEVFNREVIRVLKRMPDWKPGSTAGKNVSVYYSLPVSFMEE